MEVVGPPSYWTFIISRLTTGPVIVPLLVRICALENQIYEKRVIRGYYSILFNISNSSKAMTCEVRMIERAFEIIVALTGMNNL